jgi:hypothetical protein
MGSPICDQLVEAVLVDHLEDLVIVAIVNMNSDKIIEVAQTWSDLYRLSSKTPNWNEVNSLATDSPGKASVGPPYF